LSPPSATSCSVSLRPTMPAAPVMRMCIYASVIFTVIPEAT
jgi:hypothetical protein